MYDIGILHNVKVMWWLAIHARNIVAKVFFSGFFFFFLIKVI